MKIIAPKKLIEVALPLDEINKAAAKEKSIRHGHPSSLHLWWARRPLAAARAVLFAQLVNDPSWKYDEHELKKPQVRSAITRKRNDLFKLITQLVQWENTTNTDVLSQAQAEIHASWKETCDANRKHPSAETLFNPARMPGVHDPFAGGGTIPLEAQRLGLDAYATDLNPVAVLINKAMIEIPPRFAGRAPIGPSPKGQKQTKARATEAWPGPRGLAEDVRRYGSWMRERAEKRSGHLYPPVRITAGMVKQRKDLAPYAGRNLTVIAWLWARTVVSPNPAAKGAQVPLVTSFVLSTKATNEAFAVPIVRGNEYSFRVETGSPPKEAEAGTKLSRGANFRCIVTGSPITGDHIASEAAAGRMGARLLAIVVGGDGHRLYLSPTAEQETAALTARPSWRPDTEFLQQALGFRVGKYGMTKWGDLFTQRQCATLATFADLVMEARDEVLAAALATGDLDGERAHEYAQAVAVYLGLGASKLADYNATLVQWSKSRDQAVHVFGRQALPMVWDFAEVNPFAHAAGDIETSLDGITRALESLGVGRKGFASQRDARTQDTSRGKIVSTDPPYYDNIGYADLSDFFYVWLRRGLHKVIPDLFATIAVPKAEELVATPARHGGSEAAEAFFLNGMTDAIRMMCSLSHPAFPATIYYAFKQSETTVSVGTTNVGWETFLEAVIRAGFAVTGTWPMSTEKPGRMRDNDSNALASSIILVCRARSEDAATVGRRDFLRALEASLRTALREMTEDPLAAVAPVDLAQAAIGPAMGVYSAYASVLEADGSAMTVHSALVHINKAIDEYFSHSEGELDADTRFCIGWFEQYGFAAGEFGQANVLAQAKGTSVEGVKEAGVIEAGKGKVRLFTIKELPKKWDPTTDTRTPIWEALHHMCKALGESEGDAGALLAKMPERQDAVRQLAYRLYTLCAERKGKAELGRPYNELITSWPAIVEASQRAGLVRTQLDLL